MKNCWFLTWNVVDTCYKLYFYVCYAYTCLKLSSLCLYLLNFEIGGFFLQKPENMVCWSVQLPVASCSRHFWFYTPWTRSELVRRVYQDRKMLFCWINGIYAHTMFGLWSYDYVITCVTVKWAFKWWIELWFHTSWLNDDYYVCYDDVTFVHV
jgi:hypothetical protein